MDIAPSTLVIAPAVKVRGPFTFIEEKTALIIEEKALPIRKYIKTGMQLLHSITDAELPSTAVKSIVIFGVS